jgi:ribosomal protein S18 acetylase RimI-like enzyme
VPARKLTVRRLRPRERAEALARLVSAPLANLLLIDAVHTLGGATVPGEARSDVLVAVAGGAIAGVASLQPSLAVEEGAAPEVLEAFLPHLAGVGTGLLKVAAATAEPIWQALRRVGRRAVLDRYETSYALAPGEVHWAASPQGARVRAAAPADLDGLVQAARASLREEHRPDPFEGDPDGFRRWVGGRIPRATVVDLEGALRFAGYADVQRAEGWLLQGVYTWPEARRRGLAAAGVSALCRRALEAGASHVQLAVVAGNTPAERLYDRLGFRPVARLRTILFT